MPLVEAYYAKSIVEGKKGKRQPKLTNPFAKVCRLLLHAYTC